MRFISIRAVAKAIDFKMESIELKNVSALLDKLNTLDKPDKLTIAGVEYSLDEITISLAQIQQDNQLVFQDWITNDTAFYALLTKEQVTKKQPDDKRFKGHFLEQEFYIYLSQFLFPILQKKMRVCFAQLDYERAAIFQAFANYLTKENRIIIHQFVSQQLKEILASKLAELTPLKTSEELIEGLKPLRHPGFVDCFNSLDKSFYSTRIELVKFLKSVIEHPKCDVLVIRSIRSSMMRLELNPEQKEELDGFFDVTFTKVKKSIGKSKNRWVFLKNAYFWLIVVLLLVVASITFYFNLPENKVEPPRLISGLDSLDKDQIVNVDTLLGLNLTDQEVILEKEDDVFQPDLTFVFPSKEIKNEAIKELHGSMITDYNLQNDLMLNTRCSPISVSDYKSFTYDILELADKLSGPYHQFKNSSDYEVFIVVFENKENGKKYGKFIPKGGQVSIGLSTNHSVFFYIGEDLTKFNAAKWENNGYGSIDEAKKISKNFTAHYCDMDYNTLMALSKIYTVKPNSSTGGTTTITGSYYDGFSIRSVVLGN
jgi:hypothetical protein